MINFKKEKINYMSVQKIQFKNVRYLWHEAKAAAMSGDEVALLIYRSNLLGADLLPIKQNVRY
jgi:hypothetical protein